MNMHRGILPWPVQDYVVTSWVLIGVDYRAHCSECCITLLYLELISGHMFESKSLRKTRSLVGVSLMIVALRFSVPGEGFGKAQHR